MSDRAVMFFVVGLILGQMVGPILGVLLSEWWLERQDRKMNGNKR